VDQELSPSRAIRVLIQQPALPAYRVPVFAALAATPGLRVRIAHAGIGVPPSVEGRGFRSEICPDLMVGSRRAPLRWSGTQWRGASGDECDVIVLEWNIRVLSLLPAVLRARRHGVSVVLWGHARSARASRVRRYLRNRLGFLADAVLVYSHEGRRYLLDQGFEPGRVFVALNTQDQAPIQRARERWLAEPGPLQAFRAEHEIGNRPLILFSSTLLPEKRADLLLDAVAILRRRGLDPLTAIIGTGPHEPALREQARRLGLEPHVRFLGALYDEQALTPWFLSARVFCHPRSIGLSILHAFGYGLPVVTSDNLESHHPEIGAFAHERTGLFYRDGDANALADALARLLREDVLRERCAIEARRVAIEDYPLRTMVRGLEEAIRFAHARRNASVVSQAASDSGIVPIPAPATRPQSDAVA